MLAAWLPYWPLWLEQRGFTKPEISLLLAASIWARVVATPIVASHADRSGRRKRAMIVLTIAALVGFVPFAWAQGFGALLALCLLFGVTFPPLIPLTDGLTVAQARETPGLHYGRIRLFGSLAFLATVIALGRVLDSRSADVVHVVIVVALAVAVPAACALPAPERRRTSDDAHAARQPIRTLLAQREFVLVLVATGLIQGSHAAYYALSTLHWKAAGIDETTIGLLWAEGVVAEIVLFAVGARFAERLGSRGLFVLGGGTAALRWCVLAVTTDVGWLAGTNWLHAFSFGATHLATIGFVTHRVPPALLSTAQSLLSAISTGAATALATMLAGALYATRPEWAFGSMIVLATAGAGCAFRVNRISPVG